ncbi:MAG: hypothetical protein ACK4NY_16390 [Spirosomataceae bacterium]
MKLSNIGLWMSVVVIGWSCGSVERVDTTKIKAQMEASKIKRITPAQINNQVEKWGSEMSKALTASFEKEMKTANQARIEEICQLKKIKLMDSISTEYKVKIRLLGMPDSQSKMLYPKEKEVLDAYIYNAENKLPMGDNIQRIGDSLYVFTSPIPAQKGVAKLCFSDETYNFAIWSIVFRKADVILKTNTKTLKP